MKREELIKKWLDDELNTQELKAFKQLEDYEGLVKLSSNVKHFKTEDFNSEEELARLKETLKSKPQKQTNWLKPLLRIAAVFAIGFGFYFYTSNLNTNIDTEIAQTNTISLPDNSSVKLNALSSITFNKKNWQDNREVQLNGEAYFKVAKGETFSVKTDAGLVTVLGTQFNVKHRDNIFEVVCYEGSVSVTYNTDSTILKPGNHFLVRNGTLVKTEDNTRQNPSWVNGESTYKSVPFKEVVAEFERQYNITFNLKDINTEQLFTGGFAHNDIDLALQAISLPLNLTYTKTNNTVTLKSAK